MPPLFFRQLGALFWKNWIVLSKHPFLNILRCFILPVAYGAFLAEAQNFLIKRNNYGLGSAVPVPRLVDEFDGSLPLLWTDAAYSFDQSSSLTPESIISELTAGFTPSQMRAVKRLDNTTEIIRMCPQNFRGFSECYGAIVFDYLPDTGDIGYTILADVGLFYINVKSHTSDFEKRVLPMQWAMDQAIIKLRTGVQVPTPLEWPFTQQSNQDFSTSIRLSYVRGLRTLLVLALYITYIGIAYQLPGAFSGERAKLITSHMKTMGLLDSARITSWHLSFSLVYLPAWVIVAVVWRNYIFTASSAVIIIAVHVISGLVLASWSLFIAVPFGKSPQLAAIVSTILVIIFAVFALVLSHLKSGVASIFTIVFPPSFYIFAIRAICGFENHQVPTNILKEDPDNQLRLLPLMVAAIVAIFLWPFLAVLWEHYLYDARESSSSSWFSRSKNPSMPSTGQGIAISVRNLGKTFSTSMLRRKDGLVTAISDLSFDVPKFGIFVLLGSNGAGKSTVLSILGGLISRTSGSIAFEGGLSRPSRGTIGIVPQKNVLFPELSCYQTLRVWYAIKWSENSAQNEDFYQLLRDCDLGNKIHANAGTLSGGQKRKLQLAIGLVSGSRLVLVDECTSGIDPLSRRALWRTLTAFRNERTIVLTTHFLDEADLLADYIAVLAIPGKLVAEGSPVALKRDRGLGYSVQITFVADPPSREDAHNEILRHICTIAPDTQLLESGPQSARFRLCSKDSTTVEQVLRLIESLKQVYGITSYDIHGTSIEEIFLDLMNQSDQSNGIEKASSTVSSVPPRLLDLRPGQKRNSLSQALTIFHKRALIARRSWLAPLLTILIAVIGSCVPLFFMSHRKQTCIKKFAEPIPVSLYLPNFLSTGIDPSPLLLTSPPNVTSVLGHLYVPIQQLADNTSFVSTIEMDYRNFSLGGVSVDLQTGNSLLAWEATPPGINGPVLLNLVTNILLNNALGSSVSNVTLVKAVYEIFPPREGGTLFALKWAGFFGLAMSVFPAFYALYVARERHTSVQAMQFSNGLSNPVGLWLGHLLFDSVFTVILSTIIVIIFATASNQFHGLGFVWLLLVLYGIVGALFSYCVALLFVTPLAAFAAVAGYQTLMFMFYVAGYLLTLTYAKISTAPHIINVIHFTISLLSPVASIMRACLVAVNLFSLLCSGNHPVDAAAFGQITKYGGPILYLFFEGSVLFAILVLVDSGSWRIWRSYKNRRHRANDPSLGGQSTTTQDVLDEAKSVTNSNDLLRVLGVTKAFGRNTVVENVNFGVSRNTIFALLGPNGAGKTTMFNIIRGDIVPNSGLVIVNGTSVIHHPTSARISLGVCPQFTAIDSQLTVKEHLMIYGRLKGLRKGEALNHNVESLMRATALHEYSDRLASKLSGGNQRKLALAIALIGNPSVVLIDEFSTGIDARMKRDMWVTLRNVAVGKAIVITTHSMEEASALANKVGIMAKRMLAVGTTSDLSARYAMYEVQFSCQSREDVSRAQQLMARIPGSRMADDVATRFEVPIGNKNGDLSLADLFHTLSSQGDFSEYSVEKAGLESRRRWCCV